MEGKNELCRRNSFKFCPTQSENARCSKQVKPYNTVIIPSVFRDKDQATGFIGRLNDGVDAGITSTNHKIKISNNLRIEPSSSNCRLSAARLVKLRQEAALLDLLQETEVGDISRLQRFGLWIVFAIQDGL
jgi:hypothetical protein